MHQGTILASGSPEEIRNNESVKDAVFGPTHA
jgi:ABC-type branched-subunit amino acid transport system ATPase component